MMPLGPAPLRFLLFLLFLLTEHPPGLPFPYVTGEIHPYRTQAGAYGRLYHLLSHTYAKVIVGTVLGEGAE